jgi:hypothetical protein
MLWVTRMWDHASILGRGRRCYLQFSIKWLPQAVSSEAKRQGHEITTQFQLCMEFYLHSIILLYGVVFSYLSAVVSDTKREHRLRMFENRVLRRIFDTQVG